MSDPQSCENHVHSSLSRCVNGLLTVDYLSRLPRPREPINLGELDHEVVREISASKEAPHV